MRVPYKYVIFMSVLALTHCSLPQDLSQVQHIHKHPVTYNQSSAECLMNKHVNTSSTDLCLTGIETDVMDMRVVVHDGHCMATPNARISIGVPGLPACSKDLEYDSQGVYLIRIIRGKEIDVWLKTPVQQLMIKIPAEMPDAHSVIVQFNPEELQLEMDPSRVKRADEPYYNYDDYDPDTRLQKIFDDLFVDYYGQDEFDRTGGWLKNVEHPVTWLKRSSDRFKRSVEGEGADKAVDNSSPKGATPHKKAWENSNMAWIKREEDQEKRKWENSNMAWIKREEDPEKRRWENSNMAWIKREEDPEKRRWENSNMAWIKREENPEKRRWENSNMAWIKREDQQEKRAWENSNMAWIKREDEPEKKTSDHLSIKAPQKKVVKRDLKNSHQSRMDKSRWQNAGMRWIKRFSNSPKEDWPKSRYTMKRLPNDWGNSGMAWIKK